METCLVQDEVQSALQAQRRQHEEKIEQLDQYHKEEIDKIKKSCDEKVKRLAADGDREAR